VPPAVELLNYETIRKTLARIFFPKLVWIFHWAFSLRYILKIAGRVSEAAMGGEGGAQRLDLPVYES
jgi:hypothetical protein